MGLLFNLLLKTANYGSVSRVFSFFSEIKKKFQENCMGVFFIANDANTHFYLVQRMLVITATLKAKQIV